MKRTRSSKAVKVPTNAYTPTISNRSYNKDRNKARPTIENELIYNLMQFIDNNRNKVYPITFEIMQIYTNSSRMYCNISEDMFVNLFGNTIDELEYAAEQCSNGYFPFKRNLSNEFRLAIKFQNKDQISMLEDENAEYGYRTNIVVNATVKFLTYYNYPEEQNYGICVKLDQILQLQ